MALSYLNNGAGGTTGDQWATCSPLTTSGSIWYVQSTTGVDSVNNGKTRELPVATLAQAQTNASDGDIIVCLSAHAETLAAALSISKKLLIVGEGSSAGVPTVTFLGSSATEAIFSVTTTFVELRNLKFPQTVVASRSVARINFSTADCTIDGCYFQSGAEDDAAAVLLTSGTDRMTIKNTTFISVATAVGSPPNGPVLTNAALSDLTLDGVVFSGGTTGFASGQPFAFASSAGTITRFKGIDISLLLGADMSFGASTTGKLNVSTCTGGSRVLW